jgi:hypothetical protein
MSMEEDKKPSENVNYYKYTENLKFLTGDWKNICIEQYI